MEFEEDKNNNLLGLRRMFILNVEGTIRKNDKWLIIERSKKEEYAGKSFLFT